MCDYCDCRSHGEIATLSEQHQAVQEQLAHLAATVRCGDLVRTAAAVDVLVETLVPHTEREERGIFAQLRAADVDHTYVARFERDHVEIDDLLASARQDLDAAAELIRRLNEHIAREESDLYPAAHQLLSPQQWDAIAPDVPAGGDHHRSRPPAAPQSATC